ncbi:MAG: YfhO family protein [Bacteroidota bacterium]
MSKQTKERTSARTEEPPIIPPRFQHHAAIGLLILSLVIFFREPIFGGKVFLGADNIASNSFATFLSDAKQEGVFPLWNPYIFCGMPAYGSLSVSGDRYFDLSSTILGLTTRIAAFVLNNQSAGWVIFYYMVFAVGMYLLAWSKLQSKIAATLTSFATTFSTFIIIWIMAGHNTKIAVIALFPFIFYTIERLRDRFQWSLALLLAVLLHFSFLPSHVQMIFYMYLAVGLYFVFFLIRSLVKKEDWKGLVRTGVVFVGATAIAFCMDADKYLSVLEYNPHSIRGSGPIAQVIGEAGKSTGGGLDYDYATSWSWGVGEAFTVFIPSLYGFGKVEYRGPLTNNQPQDLFLYFGPQPWTDAPQYMGIVVLVLAMIGFWRHRHDPFVQYIAILIVFSVLVAFGKELPLVYDLMYNYVPMFNKFRVPSMILVLVQIMIPLLAGYGIASLIAQGKEYLSAKEEKRWKIVVGSLAALFILSIVARGVFIGIYEMLFPPSEVSAILAQKGYHPRIVGDLYNYIAGLVATDFTVAFGVLLLSFGSIYFWLRRSMKLTTMVVLLGFAVLIDLWRVNTGPMDPQEKGSQQSAFAAPDYVRAILDQEGMTGQQGLPKSPFRVLEFENGVPPYSNMLAYWRLQSAYGYQGAKMRRYQDLVDVAGLQNPLVWQMMNVKYIITDTPDSSRWLGLLYDGPNKKVYVNRSVLPRAFFVNRYEVGDGLDVLRKIASREFDARDVVYLSADPGVKIDPPLPGMEANFTEYGINHFVVDVKTYGTNLLFLSESYYPKGWKAFLNGSEILILRANYHFRAVIIPPGTHKLELKFEPTGFFLGKTLSLGANVIVLLAFGWLGWDSWRKRKS